jgi:NADPH2:quinone reductase
VAFADVPFANAEFVAAPASHLIPLPADVSFEVAASLLLQGMTAQYLATDSHATKSGEIALIHAAAGGVGQLLTQISRILGATVIGLTSSPAKQVVSSAAGASAVFLYSESWQNQVREFTGGNGVDVVYDSVGSTLTDSIKVTKECGQIVFYGMAGGNPAPVDPRVLMDGSKTLTGGDLWSYLTSAEKRISRANQLFEWVRQGQLRLEAPTTFQLAEGRQAHEYLESRQSTGKILLLP